MSESFKDNANSAILESTFVKSSNDGDDEILSGDWELNYKNIKKLGNKIKLTDYDENGLENYCYDNSSEPNDPRLLKCRGLIFHNKKIVMEAFPYTQDYTNTQKKEIEEILNDNFDNYEFYDSHEGFLIRMFYFANKWYISTHRKLNAFKSKWNSKKSFGSLFKQALEAEIERNSELREKLPTNKENILEKFESLLDTNKQYMFLVKHNEDNRIVCLVPESPILYHVGTFINGKLVTTENCYIPKVKKHNFGNINELIDYVGGVNIMELQGIICFAPNNKQYKILQENYLQLFMARGNEPSIKFRYLQVRMDKEKTDMLFYLYPNSIPKFEEIENNLYDIACNIYQAYINRYIKKTFVTLPRQEFNVMKTCHSWHQEDKNTNIININKVIDVLNLQHPSQLNKMLKLHYISNNKNNTKENV